MMGWYLGIILNLSHWVFAADVTPIKGVSNLKSAGALSTEYKAAKFIARLQPGFHFNLQAPNSIVIARQVFKPQTPQAQEMVFKLQGLTPEAINTAKATLFVCDDQVTFCEIHQVSVAGESEGTDEASRQVAEANKPTSTETKPSAQIAKTKVTKPNAQGFIENDLPTAIELAKKNNQLLLVDFAAKWCPGCARYEHETFPTANFKKQTKDFVKVKIDLDLFENFVLGDNYKINAIPTLLIFTTEMKEVARLVDYQPDEVLQPFLQTALANPTPLENLTAKKELGNDLLLAQGKRLIAAEKFTEAQSFLKLIEPAPIELTIAKVGQARVQFQKDEKLKSSYIAILEEALTKESFSWRALSWRLQLVELLGTDSGRAQAINKESLDLVEQVLTDKEAVKKLADFNEMGEFSGYETLLFAMSRAELTEKVKPDEAAKAWSQAALEGEKLKITPDKTGPAVRQLFILMRAKEYAKADKWAQSILKHDRLNADVKRRHISILLELKKFPAAEKLAENELKAATGRFEFWIATSLAKAYIGNQKVTKAKAFIEKYLQRTELQWPKMQSTKKGFEDLLKTI